MVTSSVTLVSSKLMVMCCALAAQVRQRESGHGAGSVSALRPLRAAILELLQLRRRAGLHALSQVPAFAPSL